VNEKMSLSSEHDLLDPYFLQDLHRQHNIEVEIERDNDDYWLHVKTNDRYIKSQRINPDESFERFKKKYWEEA
jgi:hypothetical protein